MRDPRAILNSREQAKWRDSLKNVHYICSNLKKDLKIGTILPKDRLDLTWQDEHCRNTMWSCFVQVFPPEVWRPGGGHHECDKAAVQVLWPRVWWHSPETCPGAHQRGGAEDRALRDLQTQVIQPQSLEARDGQGDCGKYWEYSSL